MDLKFAQELMATYRDGLLGDTVPFWLRHAVDHEFGGFLTSLDRDGTVIDTDKGVWQQARFTWLLAKLYNSVEPRDEWLTSALAGAKFMEDHCYDARDGRMWFHVTRDGKPLRKRRYAYTESFAAIAFGELAKATGDARYADRATAAFHRYLQHREDETHAKFTAVRPTRSLGIPMIAIGTAQELRDSICLSEATEKIDAAIEVIEHFHMKPSIECVMELVAEDGSLIDHFDGRTLNPGHAIEAAWFLLREGDYRCEPRLIQLGCQILDWMWQRGWDHEYGGILYFTDVRGLPVQEYWHDMKFWWPHNETIIATLLAYLLTNDDKYLRMHKQVHQWAYAHFPDQEHGEWFGYVHRDGRLSSSLKGNLWKGAFHYPRMQLVCWKWLAKYIERMSEPQQPRG